MLSIDAHLALPAFLFGATVGSFLNVVIHRLPRGESVVTPRSRCPSCGDMIPGWLNVPILSWLMLRGRCRKCRSAISVRYPVVELLTALLFLAALGAHGPTVAAVAGMVLAALLVAITFIDIDHWTIPDELSLPGIALGLVLRPLAFDVPWWEAPAAAAIGALFLAGVRALFFLVRKVEGMGLGDVKLIAMIGAFVGLRGLLPVMLVASFSGSIIGGLVLLFGRRGGAQAPEDPPPADPEASAAAAQPPPADPQASEPSADPQASEPPADPLASEPPAAGEPDEEEDDWVPPATAVPFGPFLAMGALAQYLLGPTLERLFLFSLGEG